jgi:hypothetical protein
MKPCHVTLVYEYNVHTNGTANCNSRSHARDISNAPMACFIRVLFYGRVLNHGHNKYGI